LARKNSYVTIPLLLSMFLSVVTLPLSSAEMPQSSETWLADLRAEALVRGISQATLNEALSGLEPIPRVIELDRNQPEFKLTFAEYLNRVVPQNRVVTGRKKLREHQSLLTRISQRYGVQPRFLVALWGIETDFGRYMGDFPMIGAIATLAYDGRRSSFFRNELFHALRIVQKGHIAAPKMRGSWAGAMGQVQFMPSTFQSFAVDYDGDGRIDIWSNLGDVFASAANYLCRSGWVADQIWGREVSLPTQFNRKLVSLKTRKRLTEWQALAVRRLNGKDLPMKPNLLASVVQPDGPEGKAFIVYRNYRALLEWNQSVFFGLAVGILADRIVGR
jgi:membrane-bound lytic murein transglycosylase B